jgi:hypothetical protein
MCSFIHAHRPARSSGQSFPGNADWLPMTQRGDAVERGADMLADRATATPGTRRRLRPSQSWAAGRAAGAGVVPSAGGRPLEPGVRAGMESSFGHDFSTVRVHSGDEASLMARRMRARAYAVGHDIVLGAGEAASGDAGRRLLAHELAHVVQYDLSGRAVLARTTPPTAPPPVAAVIQYEETPLPGGRVRMRAWGRVGDPVARSGYEGKWPGPGEVGLEGMDRWHLAGPDATGGEIGIAYTPKNFNIGKTATIENVLRNARGYMRAVGGEVYFDFTADCRIVGEHQGVSIRVVEDVHWQIDGRLSGGNNIIQILDEHAVVPAMPSVTPAAPTPSPAQITQAPGTAMPEPTPTKPASQSPVDVHQKPTMPKPTSTTPAPESSVDVHQGATMPGPAPTVPEPTAEIEPQISTTAEETLAPEVSVSGGGFQGAAIEFGGVALTVGIGVALHFLEKWYMGAALESKTKSLIEDLGPEIKDRINGLAADIAKLQLRLDKGEKVFANITVDVLFFKTHGTYQNEFVDVEVALGDVNITTKDLKVERSSEGSLGGFKGQLQQHTVSSEVKVFTDQQLEQFNTLSYEYLRTKRMLGMDPANQALLGKARRLRGQIVKTFGDSAWFLETEQATQGTSIP